MSDENQNKEEKVEIDNFELPKQVTVYTDPNSGICESCQ